MNFRFPVLLSLFCFALAMPGRAQWAVTVDPEPQQAAEPGAMLTSMKLDKEHIDLGKIVKGEKVIYEITFTNTGAEGLLIETVKPSCSCSTPEWSYDAVKPGEKGKITVTYNTEEKTPGQHEGSITIVYNGVPNIERVTFNAEVVAAPEKGATEEAPQPPHNE
jgi:hypothetical protein